MFKQVQATHWSVQHNEIQTGLNEIMNSQAITDLKSKAFSSEFMYVNSKTFGQYVCSLVILRVQNGMETFSCFTQW